MTGSINKLITACLGTILLVGTLSACGGGGERPVVTPESRTVALPEGHGVPAGTYTIEPGATRELGNVEISCPAGNMACVLTVASPDAATGTYQTSGGTPTVMSALASVALPVGHGVPAGTYTIEPGATRELGSVEFSCPSGGPACVVSVANDGTIQYERTGGMPSVSVLTSPRQLPSGHKLATNLSELPESTIDRLVESVGAAATSAPTIVGSDNVSGVVQRSRLHVSTFGLIDAVYDPREHEAPLFALYNNASFSGGNSIFVDTRNEDEGVVEVLSEVPGSPWRGVAYSRSFEELPDLIFQDYFVFFSDVEDYGDTDYMSLGYWYNGVSDNIRDSSQSVGASVSGNDPVQNEELITVQGVASYRGGAGGLYAATTLTPAFQNFEADVTLTADFSQGTITGSITDGRDTETGREVFAELTLGQAAILSYDVQPGLASFEGSTVVEINGRNLSGNWGGLFFGADAPDYTPGSVAGTFGAAASDHSESLLGVFGAYQE